MQKVPYFNQVGVTYEDMSQAQREFYDLWERNFSQGINIDVKGNISYLFIYMFKVIENLSKGNVDNIIRYLLKVKKGYGHIPKINDYCNIWIADAFVLKNDLESALKYRPDKYTFRYHFGKTYTHEELVEKFPVVSEVTDYGKNFIDEIKLEIVNSYKEHERKNKEDIIEECTQVKDINYNVFTWTTKMESTKYSNIFFDRKKYIEYIPNVTITAENIVRERNGLPRIGEGWIGETELYYFIRNLLPSFEVIQHGRPYFLGRQHLDVYIPALKLALEYQGVQHENPVDYFGGKEAFKNIKERDERKKNLCSENGIKLIYIYPNYDRNVLIELVKSHLANYEVKFKVNEHAKDIKERLISYNKIELPKGKNKRTALEKWLYEINPRGRVYNEEEINNYINYCKENLRKCRFAIEEFHWNKELAFKFHRHRDHDGFLEKCVYYSNQAIYLFSKANKEYQLFKSGAKDPIEIHESIRGIFAPNVFYDVTYVESFTKQLFKKLAIIYEKLQDYSKAIEVVNQALAYGFKGDGTKNGFPGRKLRLEKKLKKEI